MLKLLDKNKIFIKHLTDYTDLCIESDLATADKTLSFTWRWDPAEILNEYYVEDETDLYVVKEVKTGEPGKTDIVCKINLEDLEVKPFAQFTAANCSCESAARLACAGTGWTVSVSEDLLKERSVQQYNKTPLEILYCIRDAFMCEIRFDTKNQVVYFADEFGEDRGVYFRPEINLKDIDLTSDSYDFYTRIIPFGKDGLTIADVNDGVEYLDNHQYSDKIRTLIWEDTSYEDAQALMDDAERKLQDISKPRKSYSVTVRDLAASAYRHRYMPGGDLEDEEGQLLADESGTTLMAPEQNYELDRYGVLTYALGDTINIVDEPAGIMDKQRIVKMTVYPDSPDMNKVELSNTVLSWDELQAKMKAAADAWDTITNSDGSVKGVYVHGVLVGDVVGIVAEINEGIDNSPTISTMQSQVAGNTSNIATNTQNIATVAGGLSALSLRVGTIEANYISAEQADLKFATIENLEVTNETVENLEGDYATFKTTTTTELAADLALIQSLQANKANVTDLTAATGRITTLEANSATITDLNATNARVQTLETTSATVTQLNATNARIDNLGATYATIDLANVEAGSITTAMIGTGVVGTAQIADGSVTDAKIVGLSANKITAGTIDAGTISVINLDAANITVGTINGQQISNGAIDVNKLSSSLQDTIDATITNVVVLYANGTSETTPPSSGWNSVAPAWEDGKYMWQKTVTTYTDGTVETSDATCLTGATGSQGGQGPVGPAGNGIASITYRYATTTTQTAPAASSITSTTIPTLSATNKYLWQKETISYTASGVADKVTVALIAVYGDKGNQGDPGATGNGISSITYYYATTTNQTAPAASSITGTSIPALSATNKYLWQKEVIAYTNSTNKTTVLLLAVYGDKGDAGKGISSTTITYGKSTSASTQPSSWGSTVPALSQGDWLWVKTVLTYTDNTSNTTYQKSYVGTDGEDGTSVYVQSATKSGSTTTVIIADTDGHTNTLTIVDGEDGEDGQPGTDGLSGYVHTAWANSADGSVDFSTTVSTGKQYLGVYTDNTATDSQTYTNYSWSKIKGEQGLQGDTGVGVSDLVTQYYLSTSDGSPTGGSWSTTIPEYETGKYYWTRDYITWTDNTHSTTSPVLSSGLNTAITTARSKTRVYHTATAPTDMDLIAGDTWFDVSDGYKMYRSDGTQFLADENGNLLTDENGNYLTENGWTEERFSTSAIAASAITTSLLAAGCVTADKIVSEAITTDKLAARSITANKIAVGAITATEIAAGTIKASNIDINNLFAQTINATGTISGAVIHAAEESTIGNLEKAYVSVSGNAIEMYYGDEEEPYVYFSDFRDENGLADVVDTFVGNGTKTNFEATTYIYSVTAVTIDDEPASYTRDMNNNIIITPAPANTAVVRISYKTHDAVRAYTLGTRLSGSRVGNYSFAAGLFCTASGASAFAEGTYTSAIGAYSHSEGDQTTAIGDCAHAEGLHTIATGVRSHAEGSYTSVNGVIRYTTASGEVSHAEGKGTLASGNEAHSEGHATTASGIASHAEGLDAIASGNISHASGFGTIAASVAQTAIGKYNVQDGNNSTLYGQYALIIGNGASENARSNALTVDWNGNVLTAGAVNLIKGIPEVSYSTLGISSSSTLVQFFTAFAKYVCATIKNYTNWNKNIYMGQVVPNSMGFAIFTVYGQIRTSDNMPQYGSIIALNMGGGLKSYSINNYTLTQVT